MGCMQKGARSPTMPVAGRVLQVMVGGEVLLFNFFLAAEVLAC